MTAPPAGDPSRVVHLDLADTAVRFALSFAIDEAGWHRTSRPTGGVALVGDRVPDDPAAPPLDVLVVEPIPVLSRGAVDAFLAGRVRSIVSTADPRTLPGALEIARRGLHVASHDVVEAAQGFPQLTPRLERTLVLLVRGRQNREIGSELGHSSATAKRDVAELLRRFDAPNRVALAATAQRLGLRSDGRG